jgi:hypothetical protein
MVTCQGVAQSVQIHSASGSGLLFVDFTGDRIGLHVNGRAGLADDAPLRARHPGLPVDTVPGRRPEQWVVAEVEKAYIHCAKHISRLVRPRDRCDQASAEKSDYFGVGRVLA